ncbi:MAG: hypothetical protein QXT64_04685 [Desulfurococcaceae archaeon]
MSDIADVLIERKPEYRIILECVGDGTIMSDLVTCILEKGVKLSPGTIMLKVNTLVKYGVLKSMRMGKYTVVKPAFKKRRR